MAPEGLGPAVISAFWNYFLFGDIGTRLSESCSLDPVYGYENR